MTAIEAMEEYLAILKQYNGRDDKTIVAYKSDIREGIKYLFGTEDCTIEELNNINYKDIVKKWFIPLRNKGIKATTINRKRASFKSYYNSLIAINKVNHNPVAYVSLAKDEEQFQKKILNENEIIKLLKTSRDRYINQKDYNASRDNLIINILISTGMRVHEVEKMDIKDINFATGEFICIGKRKLKRNVALNEYVLKLYREFLFYRNQMEGKNDTKNSKDALFLSRNKMRITTRSIERLVENMLKLAGLAHVTPHSFKHSFVSTMCGKGEKLETIGKITGNKNIQTMYKHYMHLGEEQDIIKIVNDNPIYDEIKKEMLI